MSFLGILFGGLFSVLLWFEVSDTSSTMDPHERTAFILAGIVETLLLMASVVGFAGAIARKQVFIQAYSYFISFHFFVNLAVAIYFFYIISHFESSAITLVCDNTVKNPGTQSQCTGLLSDFRTIYIVVALVVLFIELYGAIIVARYVHQIKTEKTTARTSRMMLMGRAGRDTSSMMPGFGQSSMFSEDHLDDIALIPKTPLGNGEFNPYEEPEHPRFSSYSHNAAPSDAFSEAPMSEEGYGGGSWTHQDIAAEEKSPLPQDSGDDIHPMQSSIKSAAGPSVPSEVDPLPRYSLESPELR